MSVGELTVNVKADVSELTAGMEETRDQLEQTTRTIEVQDATWKGLANSAVQSAGEIAPAIGQITEAAASLAGAVISYRQFNSVVVASGGTLAGIGSAILNFGGIALRVAGMIVPQWRVATAVIGAGLIVYKVATSDMAAEAYKAASGNANISESVDKLGTALGKLGDAAGAPFGMAAAGAESFLDSINPFPYVLGRIAKKTAEWIDTATAGVEYITPLVVEFGDQLETAVFVTSSWGQATAEQTQNFYEQGKALRELAAETERLIALQEAQRPLFQNLGAMQDHATAAAEHAAEVRRLASIDTIESLNKETLALQQKAAAEVFAGKATEDSQNKTAALFAAIANQRQAILAGNVQVKESPVEAAIESARKALYALEFGQDAAAVAALRAKGATDEQVASLEALQAATARVIEQQQQEREAGEALAQASRESAAAIEKAEADAAAAEIDKLKETEEENEKKKKSDKTDLKAAFAGTSESASIMLRGIGGDRSQNLEKIGNKQLAELKKLNAKNNQPQSLTVAKV